MTTAHRGTRAIRFASEGDGIPVLLLPGLGGGARLFGTLPRRFARTGFRCTTYDPVGVPPSSPLPDGRFDFDAAAADVLAVLDTAGIETCALVGSSLGGKVGLTAAVLAPERVTHLVLLASSAIVTERARRVYRFFEHVATHLGDTELAEALAPFLFGASFHTAHPRVVDDIVRATRLGPEVRELMIAQARALGSFDGSPAAREVRCPVLCAAGSEDTLTTGDEVRRTAELIASARFVEFANAGHSLLLEGKAVFDAVCEFVS